MVCPADLRMSAGEWAKGLGAEVRPRTKAELSGWAQEAARI